MFLQIGTRFVTVSDTLQIRVVENKLTGYFIGTQVAVTPTFITVAPGSDVSVGNFGNGGFFNKTITS